jgi:hypothetical protein
MISVQRSNASIASIPDERDFKARDADSLIELQPKIE